MHVVVDVPSGLRSGGGRKEVEPGVCETDDGAGDVMLTHERQFLVNRGI